MTVKDFTIFLDLDGTLKTEVDLTPPFEVETLNVQSGTRSYNIGVRPNLIEFLDYAKSKASLALSTASGRRYARSVVNEMGIYHYFDHFYTIESFNVGIPFFSNCIFIDNHEDAGMQKMDKMAKPNYGVSVVRNDLWTIDTYFGTKDDTTMLDLIKELKDLA